MSEESNLYTFENETYRKTYWHTCSHILAQAVKRLYPEVKLAIGPSIDEGFYYDMDSPFPFTPEIMENIESEMRKICKEKLKLERFELPRAEAVKFMEEKDEPFKVELINDLPEDAAISFYKQGEFTDLCAGPHLDSTGRVKGNAIKLTACNAAYWRGDSNRETLQRIYGIAFPKKDELDAYLQRIEEAKKRDHRKLGKELGLFMLRDEGPGFPFFLPKGMVLKNTLLDYWRQVHKKYGYVEISTPIMLNRQLWERSGHWDHYKNNMYTTVIDEVDFAVKPMNCPGGMLVYASEPHSYKELPLRVGEIGLVHRHELSGALHGLFRVRCFSQDDAHVFMTREQMQDVIQETVRLFDEVYSTFGLSYTIELSTMPEDHIGTVEEWERNQDILKTAITDMGKEFVVNEGDGAFYGPKLDFHLSDSLGRTWQCGTIQLDSQLPERFELEYTGEDGQKHRPGGAGLHRALHRRDYGALCRGLPPVAESCSGEDPHRHRPGGRLRNRIGRPTGPAGVPGGNRCAQRENRQKNPGGHFGKDSLYAGGGRPGRGKPDRLCPHPRRRGPGRHEPGGLCHEAAGRSGQQDHYVNQKSKGTYPLWLRPFALAQTTSGQSGPGKVPLPQVTLRLMSFIC